MGIRQTKKRKAKADRASGDYLARSFLEFFEGRGHTVVPSAPLLPEDPTLLFTAAGMVPFKSYFTAPESAPYPTAASVQKCLRAGGKQSDLENVGRTLRHHTFFEMLGNFSFGDYFKKEAIDWAWELSVDVWGMDRDHISVSVFTDPSTSIPADDEAYDLWAKRIGVPKDRIVRLGRKDNFWGPVGETGVCGPSSELYYDTGEARGCGRPTCAPGCDCDRYIEFWNLVFPQFFYTETGRYDPLPKPGIDTGMGLERVAFILQGVEDNFHTDLFLPIRDAIERAVPKASRDAARLAINAGADHVRALVFALAEGIMPSNEGRGYVLRRLLRRALTKMHPYGVRKPFLAPAVDAVIATMGGRYPEITQRAKLVREVITSEEERFLATVEQGLTKLDGLIERTRAKKRNTIAGRDVFVLYDTYGFPVELTRELAEDAGLAIDERGYLAAMEEQRVRARGQSFHAGAEAAAPPFVEIEPFDATEFVGYENLECDAAVMAWRSVTVESGDVVDIATDRTVFYPEGGGQVGDGGTVDFGKCRARVLDTFREGGRVVLRADWGDASLPREHIGDFMESNRRVHLSVDRQTRLATARNHTATHLLHAALRKLLGTHVSQAGSLVAPDRLRFDFHHHHALGADETDRIQTLVNEKVLDDLEISAAMMPFKDAVAQGAMALFGEKYADTVRVVSIDGFSKELCGGTHLHRTGEIGTFLITHETAVAAGVRRIEAVTGFGALQHVGALVAERCELARTLRTSPEDLRTRVHALVDDHDTLRRRLSSQEDRLAGDRVAKAIADAKDIGGVKLLLLRLTKGDVPSLRRVGDEIRSRMPDGVGLVGLDTADKKVLLIVVPQDLIEKGRPGAGQLARGLSEEFSFKGGGKPHMAQMGLTSTEDFEKVERYVRAVLTGQP